MSRIERIYKSMFPVQASELMGFLYSRAGVGLQSQGTSVVGVFGCAMAGQWGTLAIPRCI